MLRKSGWFTCALAMGAMMLPAAALADDPHDPAMRSAKAHAKDSAETKRLNQGQLAYVRKRDAQTMQSYRKAKDEGESAYADARADYERKMAAWRKAVAECRAGHTEYCEH